LTHLSGFKATLAAKTIDGGCNIAQISAYGVKCHRFWYLDA